MVTFCVLVFLLYDGGQYSSFHGVMRIKPESMPNREYISGKYGIFLTLTEV